MHCKVLAFVSSLFLFVELIHATSGDSVVCNANHIFNAVHSSMRQWGGSLNHNGMSFFLATVPEGTQLYHGTSDPDSIRGLQWLAFEPEHALVFARPRGGPGSHPPGEGPPGEGPPGHGQPAREESDAEGTPHRGQGWEHYGLPPKHEHGPPPSPPHKEESYNRPFRRPTHDEDREHHQPPLDLEHCPLSPLSHERGPCSGKGRRPPHYEHEPSPPPPDREHGPRKGGSHREHGAPPPLPPGHIYRPYPPPPRQDRPYKGPKKFWNTGYKRLPLPAHLGDSSKHSSLSPPDKHDHDQPTGPPANREDLKRHKLPWKRQAQQPLNEPVSPNEERVGYLHTYIPKHPLRLLYIDGLSAAKTSNGTLDTQDYLLLNRTADDIGGPMGGELMRAKGLCELAATIWENKVDGILRLEGGFEIILCDFEKHLERKDVVTVTTNGGQRWGPMGRWQYIKAITSRYNGIGGNRVHVDYNNFVSVFAYEDLKGLWDNNVQSDYRMPRLTNVAPKDLHRIKDDVTSLILSKNWAEEGRTDWQAVADNVVARYSSPLHHITNYAPFREHKEELAAYLTALLRPFIDDSARNASLETLRCTSHLVPPLPSLSIPPASLTPLAHRALHAVTTRICDSLLTSLSVASSSTPHTSFTAVYAEHATGVIDELVAWLNWTTWKECGTCEDEEVCFVPIWPRGNKEDHRRPRCKSEREIEGGMGYWGIRTRPPPGKGTKDGKEKDKKNLRI